MDAAAHLCGPPLGSPRLCGRSASFCRRHGETGLRALETACYSGLGFGPSSMDRRFHRLRQLCGGKYATRMVKAAESESSWEPTCHPRDSAAALRLATRLAENQTTMVVETRA